MKIYNTLTRKKETIKPRVDKKIDIFVCGPTVYDSPHLGHARIAVFFDCFVKYLRQRGYKVKYIVNITDVDDKIILRAKEKGVSVKDIATVFEKEYLNSMRKLKVTAVTKYARATQHIKEIISQIKRLEEKGFTYRIENDGIYYDISKFKNYGKLARRTVLQAEDGVSRIDDSAKKKNKGDFCLWKFTQSPEEPSWKSPWGNGRPGWHIEDTAISEKYLGCQYDIHGGGRDLIFPHHEAEISQMEAISGKSPFVKYWMHVGFVNISGQKMSKSLGNFISVNDFLKHWPPQCLRFLILKNLWQSPLNYTESLIIETKAGLKKIEEFLRKISLFMYYERKNNYSDKSMTLLFVKSKKSFYQYLNDNFNTPRAFSVLFDLIKKINDFTKNSPLSPSLARKIYSFFKEINSFLEIVDFNQLLSQLPARIKKMVKQRENFRKKEKWKKADEIRKKIEQEGFVIEDTQWGPLVKKKD